MIIPRIIIALIFAAVLALSFQRSWRFEEGREFLNEKGNERGETYVFNSPFVIMVALVTYICIIILMDDSLHGIQTFSYLFADVIANIFPYYILLLLFLPLLRKCISAKACAVLWSFPLFLFYQPNMLMQFAYTPKLTFYIPEGILDKLFYVWVAGFACILIWKFAGHQHFRRKILNESERIKEQFILDIWKEEYVKSNYKQEISLYFSKNVKTPLSMGVFKHTRMVVLPYKNYSEEELRFIFRHEITHLKRLDIDTKVFLTVYNALGWFNPLTWVAVRNANDDLELSCDEFVLKECDDMERKRYAELLLQTAGEAKGFTTCLSVDARALRYRLKNVIHRRKVFKGTVAIGIIFFCLSMSYGLVAFTTGRETVNEICFSSGKNVKVNYVHYENDITNDVRVDASSYDETRLMEYLSDLEVEKYVGVNDLNANERMIIGMKIDGEYQELYFSEKLLTIVNWRYKDKHYIIRSDVDWDYILSCIDT